MKVTVSCLCTAAIPEPYEAAGTSGPSGYLIGGIVALLILGYLIYSLIRPEKF